MNIQEHGRKIVGELSIIRKENDMYSYKKLVKLLEKMVNTIYFQNKEDRDKVIGEQILFNNIINKNTYELFLKWYEIVKSELEELSKLCDKLFDAKDYQRYEENMLAYESLERVGSTLFSKGADYEEFNKSK